MAYRKTLFEMRKGKEVHAGGTWKATKSEDTLIKVIMLFFSVSVIAVLLSMLFGLTVILVLSGICLAVSFIALFVVMFGLVYLKSRKQPMEKHYYSVDRTYNGIKDELIDNGHEISKEEFFGSEK